MTDPMLATLRQLDAAVPEWLRAVDSKANLDRRRVLTSVARPLYRRGYAERRRLLGAWWYTITPKGREALETANQPEGNDTP